MAKKVENGEWMTTGDPLNYLKATLAYAMERKDISQELKNYHSKSIKGRKIGAPISYDIQPLILYLFVSLCVFSLTLATQTRSFHLICLCIPVICD